MLSPAVADRIVLLFLIYADFSGIGDAKNSNDDQQRKYKHQISFQLPNPLYRAIFFNLTEKGNVYE